MRVVFLQDVPRVAKAGEVKEVADGYARNFLIPRKLALLARPEVVSQLGTAQRVEAKEDTELVALAQQIEGKEVNIKAKAGAKDRLYGSITSADIATELSKSTGLDIDKRKIELEEPLRSLGNYEITIRLAKNIVPKIKVSVTEEAAEEKPPKKRVAKKKVATPKAEKEEKKPPPKKRVAKPKPPKPKKEEKAKKEKKVTPKKAKKTPKKEEG
jgi:large subunit ribosomal protein L9